MHQICVIHLHVCCGEVDMIIGHTKVMDTFTYKEIILLSLVQLLQSNLTLKALLASNPCQAETFLFSFDLQCPPDLLPVLGHMHWW